MSFSEQSPMVPVSGISNESSNTRHNQHSTDVKMIGPRLYINGYVYIKSDTISNHTVRWECRRSRKGGCLAKASTSDPTKNEKIIVYRGLQESTHNHPPSTHEVKAAEVAARFIEAESYESQPTDQTSSDHHLGLVIQVPSNSEPQASTRKRLRDASPVKPMEMNEQTTQTGKRPARSSALRAAYSLGMDYDSLPTPPKIIGKRLNIDDFIYVKDKSYTRGGLSKTRWYCRRSRTGECFAEATTSDPNLCQTLIVYKGPDESEHNHSQSCYEVAEAEEIARRARQKNKAEFDLESDASVKVIPGSSAQSSVDHVLKIPGLEEFEKIESNRSTEQVPLNTEKTNIVADSLAPPRLIDNKLCIDGFLYHNTGCSTNSSKWWWQCRQYRTEKCYATAITSNPYVDQGLVVFKGPDQSGHCHPPPLAVMGEVKNIATSDLEKSNPKLNVTAEVDMKSAPTTAEALKSKFSKTVKLEKIESTVSLKQKQPNTGDEIHKLVGPFPQFSSEGRPVAQSRCNNGSDDADINAPRHNHHLNPESKSAVLETESRQPPVSSVKQEFANCSSRVSGASGSPRLIGRRLSIDGYLYVESRVKRDKTVWECKRYRKTGCPATALTSDPLSKEFVVYEGPKDSKHIHPPSLTELKAAEELAKSKLSRSESESKCTAQFRGKSEVENVPSSSNRSSSPTKVDRESLRRSCQSRHSTALETKSRLHTRRKYRKTKYHGLVNDDQIYRKFLAKFSTKPIFDRQSVVRALKVIYSSQQGRLMAYATVLENKEKIVEDLETLRKNPNATIFAVNNLPEQNSTISSDDSVEKNTNEELREEETRATVLTAESTEAPIVTSQTQTVRVDTVPPTPTVAIPDSSSSQTPLPASSQEELQIKQEIIFIDLTDDDNEPKTTIKQEPISSAEAQLCPDQNQEAPNIERNLAPPTQSFDTSSDIGQFGSHQQNCYYNQGPYNQYASMPPNYMFSFNNYPPGSNQFMNHMMQHPNVPGFNMQNSNMSNFAQNPNAFSFNAQNFNIPDFNGPVDDAQMRWMSNCPNLMNNAVVYPEPLYPQFQPYQPNY